ncbi:S-layer homology domain-containing protein [Aminipila sp.]|uniref:S-layer homology domain-containing protein n=1 Tax=Aminipila sp. TaxID=2060095 RepID=UPI002897098D|nr:S-layer homology domain-containing protein [Aminipila sp.]
MKIVLTNLTKKLFACFLAVIIAVPLISVPTTVYGATFSDIRGHWAESYINKAVSAGFVKGYPDGTFCPDKSVTRAEFTSMVNKALGNTGSTSVTFSDVPSNEWYYNDVAKGISAAFVGGYDNNTFRPDNAVSREEAAAMVSRFVPTYGTSGSISSFKDKGSISSWATDAVAKIYGKGYMGAYEDGRYHPQDSLTRGMTAKIICSILDKENIVSSSTTVKDKGTTLSNRIYSNNVTMHSDLGSGEAELSNCMVLGTLYVYGGGENTITVSNSRVANAYVEKSSSAVRVLAKGQTTINKTTTGNTATLETSGLSGGLYGTGFNNVDIKGSADTTLKGSFVKVNVTGSSADVDVESGAITTLNVNSSGRSSTIKLNSKASIGTANVDAAATFNGSGSINTMNVNSSGVTYETKPRYVKMGSGISSADYSNYAIAVSPRNNEKDVNLNTRITLTFNTAVTKYNGSSIRNSDIADLIYLRKGSSSGSNVSFSGSISSSAKVITLTPDRDLSDDTTYYVVISRNQFLDTNKKGNDAQTTYFSTGNDSNSDYDIAVSPKNKASNVKLDTTITLTFDTAVKKYNGSTIRDSDIADLVYLRRSSSSGSKVSFSGSINSSKKVITLTPDKNLDDDTKYYVVIDKNEFLDTKDKGNAAQTTYFTTGDDTDGTLKFYPKSGETDVSRTIDPYITFSESIETYAGKSITDSYVEDNIIFREGSSSGSKVSFSGSINSSKKTITLDPKSTLKEGQKYYVEIPSRKFRTQSDDTNIGSYSVTWTTSSPSAPTVSFTPVNGAANVALTQSIILSYSTTMYNTSGYQPSTSDMTSYITLRNNTTGSNVAFTPSISGSTMVLVPKVALTAGNSYTVSIPSGRFRNSSNIYLNSSSATFTAARDIDLTLLDTAISNANKAKEGISISANGSDVFEGVQWVTQSQLDTLNTAINKATTDRNIVSTTADAQVAANTLNAAVTSFTNGKKSGTKFRIDISALTNAVKDADALARSVRISVDGFDVSPSEKWATQLAVNDLNSAISKANENINSISTASEVSARISALSTATTAFKTDKGHMADKSKLKSSIAAANSELAGIRISDSAEKVPSGDTWVTIDEYNTFTGVLAAAVYINDKKREATQEEVDGSESALNEAKGVFIKAKEKKGTMQ